jgi:hypothetical protein
MGEPQPPRDLRRRLAIIRQAEEVTGNMVGVKVAICAPASLSTIRKPWRSLRPARAGGQLQLFGRAARGKPAKTGS